MTQLPSPPVIAVVQHDHPPLRPPARLDPFVVAVTVDGALADWRPADDMVAFADPEVVAQYTAWRASWEQTFALDPVVSVARFVERAAAADGVAAEPLLDIAAAGFELVVPPHRLAELVAAVANTAEVVRQRGGFGVGLVDSTPFAGRVGLAGAWAAGAEPEVLTADEHLTVELTPAGLDVVVAASGERLVGVSEVTVGAQRVRVDHSAGIAELAAGAALPLAWLVPGATGWRVRQVPEVVVWARTLAGIESAARRAGALGLPVRFTTASAYRSA